MLRVIFFCFAVVCFLLGSFIWMNAKSAVHEVEVLMFYLMATIFLCAAGVVEAVNRAGADVAALKERLEILHRAYQTEADERRKAELMKRPVSPLPPAVESSPPIAEQKSAFDETDPKKRPLWL